MKIVQYLLLILIFSGQFFLNAQNNINARVVNNDNNVGVAYASILSLSHPEVGAISDENGFFEINLHDSIRSIELFISASSFHPRKINLSINDSLQTIKLDENIVVLDEVVVKPLKEEEIFWDEDLSVLKIYGKGEGDSFDPMKMGLESSGEYHGNAYRIKRKIHLREIGFHFWKNKDYPQQLYLRVFSTDEKPQLSRMMPIESLNELSSRTIPLKDLIDGFNTVEISDEDIFVEPGYLILAVTADLTGVKNNKLTIYQQKTGGRDVLRFTMNAGSYTIYPGYLPKYVMGFRYRELEEGNRLMKWFKNLF